MNLRFLQEDSVHFLERR
jgi:hypothetical protein